MSDTEIQCTEACRAMPDCKRCGLRKSPRGRSVPPAAANSYCGWGCPGYDEEPRSGHLWPGEEAQRDQDSRQGGDE